MRPCHLLECPLQRPKLKEVHIVDLVQTLLGVIGLMGMEFVLWTLGPGDLILNAVTPLLLRWILLEHEIPSDGCFKGEMGPTTVSTEGVI